jgi:Cu/Ag efflux protein CusF
MKRLTFIRLAFSALILGSFVAAPAAEKTETKRHPLRGVITRIEPEASAFMVKHEEIPGVMRAMTMRFKVAPDTVQKFKVGDAITGMMSRVNNEWRLDDVKPAPAQKAK